MGFRIEAPKQDGNARFNTLKVNLNENNLATRAVVVDDEGNFYYGTGGGGGTGGVAGTSGTSGVNGTSGTSGTGFNTITDPLLGRILLSDGSTNSAIAATNLNFLNNTLQVTGSLIADSLLINSDVFEFTGSLRVLGGITGSLYGTASWAENTLSASYVSSSNVYGPYGFDSIQTASFALTASSADTFVIRSDKFEFTGSVQVLGGITGSLFGTSSWAISASWAPSAAVSATASYVSSSNVFGPHGFDSIRTASYALTASSADTFVIRSDKFEFTGSIQVLGGITGSLFGTSSWAQNAISSSYPIAVTGSNLYSVRPLAAVSTIGNRDTIFLGDSAGNSATTSNYSIFLGYFAGWSASGSGDSVFIGEGAGSNAPGSVASNFMGYGAGENAYNSSNATFLGAFAGTSAPNSNNSTFIGRNAGANAANSDGSTFLGFRAGRYAMSSSYSILIGYQAGYNAALSGVGIRSNNIIIGTNITLPNNRQNAINIGAIIFGTGSYSDINTNPYSGSLNGRIGINQPIPEFNFDVSGSGRYTNGLQVTSSLIAPNITGSLFGTASWARNALTASSADTFVIRSDKFEFTGSIQVLGGITGSLLGTSSFAITASHALNVPVTSSFALVASSSLVTDTTTGTGPYYITFVDGTSGNRPLRVDSNTLTFNATTNVLTATASLAITASTAATASSADTFVIRSDKFEFTGSVQVLGGITGSLLGTSSFAITASHALNVPVTSSFALVASSSLITDTTTGTGPYYLTFVDGTSGNRPLRVDSSTLTFNATTNVLTATASLAITASHALTSSFINATGSNAFIQGGNSFGTTATLGTNDNQNLVLETNATPRITLDTSGNTNIATGYQFSSIGTLNWGTSGYNIGQLSWNNGGGPLSYAAVYGQGIYSLRLGTITYPTALFVTASNGYVGVNNSAPLYNLDVTGTSNVSSYSIVGDWLQVYGMLYHRSNIAVLNKAQDGWVTWATRDTTEADSRIDLSNIRTITTNGTVDQVITLNATDSSWHYIGWQWAGTRQFYTGLDSSGRFAFGSDLGGSFYFNGGSVGIGNTNPQSTLHLNGSFRQVNGNIAEYKNVTSFAYDNNQTGGYVVTTPFQIGNQYEMPIIHVKGYGYGDSKLYDFKIVVYVYTPDLVQYSIVDSGNDADIKYLAEDANGFLCIVFGDLAATNYFYRFTVDCIATRYTSNNYQTGWSFTQTTSANYGMSQLYLTTPAITQTVAGKVGVGVITPQNKLDVLVPQGIAASFGGPLDPGEFSGMHFGYLETGNANYRKSALVFERTDNYGFGNNAGGKIHFLLNNNGGTSATALTDSVVTIDSDASGNVGSVRMGVGTTSPSATLHVTKSIALVTDGAAQDSAGYYPLGVTRANSPNDLAYIGMTRAGNMPFGLGINSSNQLIMGATTSGTQIITPALSLSQGGALVVAGDVTAYGSPSDISLKDIKEKIPNALDSILKLNGYKFDWKEPNEIANIKEDIGVIAQEVEELFPELVRKNKDTGMKSVRYQGLIGVLIEAIKEQQNQIDELKYLLKKQ